MGRCTGGGEKQHLERRKDDAISEICSKFLGWRVSGRGLDGNGANYVGCQTKNEERKLDHGFCACFDDEQLEPDNGRNCLVVRRSLNDADSSGSARSAERNNDNDSAEDHDWPRQAHDPRAPDLACGRTGENDVTHALSEGGRLELGAENLVRAVCHDGDAPIADEGDQLRVLCGFDL